MTSRPRPTLLLKIPLEIRYHIYSFLISTPRTISVNLHAESQHAHSKKIIIIKRGQLILKSLSETCKQLHLEIPVLGFTIFELFTNAFGIIDPRITSSKSASWGSWLWKVVKNGKNVKHRISGPSTRLLALQASRWSLTLYRFFLGRYLHKQMDGSQIAASTFQLYKGSQGKIRSAREYSWDTNWRLLFQRVVGREVDDYDRWCYSNSWALVVARREPVKRAMQKSQMEIFI